MLLNQLLLKSATRLIFDLELKTQCGLSVDRAVISSHNSHGQSDLTVQEDAKGMAGSISREVSLPHM